MSATVGERDPKSAAGPDPAVGHGVREHFRTAGPGTHEARIVDFEARNAAFQGEIDNLKERLTELESVRRSVGETLATENTK
jgi:hypothetical protein